MKLSSNLLSFGVLTFFLSSVAVGGPPDRQHERASVPSSDEDITEIEQLLLDAPVGDTQLREELQFLYSLPSATCSGTACNGKDPASTGCANDGITAAVAYATQNNVQVKVELRWSPSCKTNWARVSDNSGKNIAYYYKAWLMNQSGAELAVKSGGKTTSAWSNMWYNTTVKGCGFMSAYTNTDVGAGTCTAFK